MYVGDQPPFLEKINEPDRDYRIAPLFRWRLALPAGTGRNSGRFAENSQFMGHSRAVAAIRARFPELRPSKVLEGAAGVGAADAVGASRASATGSDAVLGRGGQNPRDE